MVFAVEEVTQGAVLGWQPLSSLCEALGGKHATVSARCYTRMCYWLGDCGHWVSPPKWANQVKSGDPLSKIIFWLGEPDQREHEVLSWSCGKASENILRAVMRDGYLVSLEQCKSE
jgi:hypothetical protein